MRVRRGRRGQRVDGRSVVPCRERPHDARPGHRQRVSLPLRPSGAESGFSLVETMVALGLVFAVLLGLLAAFDTGTRGVLAGRERTGASALAKAVIEDARAVAFTRVGHDLTGDATLATDPDLVGASPNWTYQPAGAAAPEALVGSTNPVYPQHSWSVTHDGETFLVKVYVTQAPAAPGDPYRRLTVSVTPGAPSYDGTEGQTVRLSTFVSEAESGAGDTSSGVVDVDGGLLSMTGDLQGVALDEAAIYFPYAHGDFEGRLIDETRGYAGSSRSSVTLTSGTVTGCGAGGTTAECGMTKAETFADDDGATAPPVQDVDGPLTTSGGTISAGSALGATLSGAGSVISKSSAASCAVCGPPVGDGDGKPYADDTATGSSAGTLNFTTSHVGGSSRITGAVVSSAVVDADPVVNQRKVHSTGSLTVPPVVLGALTLGPVGFDGAARINTVTATAVAEAGPMALPPSVTGGTVTINLWDDVNPLLPGYRTVAFPVGQAYSDQADVSFPVTVLGLGIANVTLSTTVVAEAAHTDSTSNGGLVTAATAELTSWLEVTTRVTVTVSAVVLADLTMTADYGRLSARAAFEGAT